MKVFVDKSRADDALIEGLKAELTKHRSAAATLKRAVTQDKHKDAVVADAARRQLELKLEEQKKVVSALQDENKRLAKVRAVHLQNQVLSLIGLDWSGVECE